MSFRGLVSELKDEKRKELVSEYVSAIRVAKDIWEELKNKKFVNAKDSELRKCLFDKCIPHLPFLVADILAKDKCVTDKQVEYCRDLFLEGIGENDSENVLRAFIKGAGLNRWQLSRVIQRLEWKYGDSLREKRKGGNGYGS